MINIGSSKISEMYVGSTKIGSAYLGSTKVYDSAPTILTVDLNNVGEDQTNTFLTQTRYPGVWTGFKVFKTNYNRTGGTFYNYLKNLSNAPSNFTFWYYIDGNRNNTSNCYGQVNYSSDGSALVSKVSGWTTSGLDSQNPRWDKSRWRSATVNISKNGNLNILYWSKGSDMWYTNALYWAVSDTLVSEVINPYS